MRSASKLIGLGALVAAALSAPTYLPPFWLYLATGFVVSAIALMGLSVLWGWTGQISVGHAAFLALGAYVGGILSGGTTTGRGPLLNVPLPLEFLCVIAVAVIAGIAVGLPALRVSGLRLAIMTLAFGELLQWAIVRTPWLTGGQEGLFIPYTSILGMSTGVAWQAYFIALAFSGVATVLMVRLGSSPTGRAMLLVRDSELAARSMAISLTRAKLTAFVVAGVYGGVAGWLSAHITASAVAQDFGLFPSVNLLVGVIIGGAGSVWGAWLGAAYLAVTPEIAPNLYPVISGAVLIVVVTLLPGGLVSIPATLSRLKRPGTTAPRMEGHAAGSCPGGQT